MPDYAIAKCARCGLLYNRNFKDGGGDANIFSESYYKDVQKQAFAHVGDAAVEDASLLSYARGLEFVESRAGVGRVLDVGCAFGSFLDVAKGRGWKVKGVEISPYSSRFAREEKKLDVLTGVLTKADIGSEPFDFITFWDVLEHVTDVTGNVRVAAKKLKPGGHLLLTTDNYQSLLAFIANTLFFLSGKKFSYPIEKFFIPFNSCYFFPRDVRRVLASEGFEEVYFKKIDYPIEKINLKGMERLVLRVLYAIGDLLNLNTQFLLIARKKDRHETD